MVESTEKPCITCIDLEDVSKGTKNMANGKATIVTPITCELLKWIMPNTHHSIIMIIDEVIIYD